MRFVSSPKQISLLLFLILSLSQTASAHHWQNVDKGLGYTVIQPASNDEGKLSLHAFKIDLKYFDLKPLFSSSLSTRLPIKQMVLQTRAKVGANANFFDGTNQPLGLIIDNRKIVNPFKKISWWGIFLIENKIPAIVHAHAFRQNPAITTAIQAGPRLVINGAIPRLKPDLSRHTAFGIQKNNHVILVVSQEPIEITELARIMAKPEKEGGLGCVNALNLDGGSSSQIYSKIGSFELDIPSYVGVPVGLGVFRR
ncbi:MAG: hypothetical protein A2048_01780 [Deltaproteobacteria bacterium GWA2_45_12]|nr:MAG: hypothetical protein A2048_01780 [Deltaproteobacteria bacterium GWA2_45_12]